MFRSAAARLAAYAALAALTLALATAARAQVQEQRPVTAGHAAVWATDNVLRDGGSALTGTLTEIGITSNLAASFGIKSGPTTAPYTLLTIGTVPGTGVQINDTAVGGATHVPINFVVNGNNSFTVNDTGVLVNGVPLVGSNIPNNTVLGNVSGSTAAPTAIGAAQLTTLLGLGTAAFVNTGTIGATIPLLSTANMWSLPQTFGANLGTGGSLILEGSINGAVTLTVPTTAGTTAISFPATSGTLVTTGDANTVTVGMLAQEAAGTVLGNTGAATANVAATVAPVLGANGGTGGSVKLRGATSGDATIRVPVAAGTATIFQLPATNGSSGQFLQTDGSGVASWQTATGSGTVNSGTAAQMTYYAGSGTTVSGNANATISAGALTLGVLNTTAGSVVLNGATSGTATVRVATAAGTATIFQLPATNGSNGQFLQTDGSGVASWQTATGSGTVNSGTAAQMTYYAGSGTTVSGNANATISAGALTLGVLNTTAGSVVLNGATSGTATISVPAVAGTTTFKLPGTAGTANFFLQTDGSGNLSWATAPIAASTFPNYLATLSTQTGTTYTFASTDCGTIVQFTNAAAVTATLPNSLLVGCSIGIVQIGAGQVTLAAGSGAAYHSAHSYTKTFGQYSGVSMSVYSNSGGTSAIYAFVGDGA